MPQLKLKSSHKAVRDYYATLRQYDRHSVTHEGAVSSPFETLLTVCAKQVDATLIPQFTMRAPSGNRIVLDGVILDAYGLPFAYWEAKDMDDNLTRAVQEKRAAGYPLDNTLFQNPQHGILYQNGEQVFDVDITDPTRLIAVLQHFFAVPPAALENWHTAVAEFKEKVPALGRKAAELIAEQHKTNPQFVAVFTGFYEQCRAAINPNLSVAAVEEMLIQHLLTERIFRTVFNNPDFTRRNIIAREIEKVVEVLIGQTYSRDAFLKELNPFYLAIEQAALLCKDFSQKQQFLNTVYEQFFQGFSVEVADTHGIVYTPQPIVDFMVKSVAHILETEFDRSLSDTGVHIIDPFVGTGNFIVRLMQDIQATTFEEKYRHELHCNEILLLPYYIASLNIEQEYFQRTGTYLPFEGIALADTFELLEDQQIGLFTQENTERVEKQKAADMFVVIGNPPYNMGQANENDNNKNRKYEVMDKRIAETYVKDSKARLRNKLYDPYVKAIGWASERIGAEGVVAFVTNNSFLDGLAFDGMRKHLAEDFDAIYILDLGGNARKGLKVSDANVFGIRVGVSINLFVKNKRRKLSEKPNIFYYRTDDLWNKKQKFDLLNACQHTGGIAWKSVQPDNRQTWLTGGLHAEFDTFIPMGSKEVKSKKDGGEAIFSLYSAGVVTSRDNLVYSFDLPLLQESVRTFIEIYNTAVDRRRRHDPKAPIEDFIDTTDPRIKWSHRVKQSLGKLELSTHQDTHFRTALYRPFCQQYLYFDHFWNERRYQQHRIFPTSAAELENRVIIVSDHGFRSGFNTLMTNLISDLHTLAASDSFQCFPFYTYNEDGTNRRENITDWALAQFRTHYGDDTITKWDIFHYNYAVLHHPDYREKYQANLKRDLPHIPFAQDFWGFANAGKALANLHVNYESVPKYEKLELKETPNTQRIDWRVEKMRFSKDKTQIYYNDYFTLVGIPAEAFAYQLGTRSALEWVVDQYRVKVDKRSEIVNDPNRADQPQYIVDLIGRVITVSLETVEIIGNLPAL